MKTKQIIVVLALWLGLGGLSSCSNESDEAVSVASVPLEVSLAPLSRAAIEGTTLPDGSRYTVYCGSDTSVAVYSGGVSTLETPIYLTGTESQTIYATYPAYAGWCVPFVASGVWPISAWSQKDILYGASTTKAGASNPKVTITMHHALARITFKVKKARVSQDAYTLLDAYLLGAGFSGNLHPNGEYSDVFTDCEIVSESVKKDLSTGQEVSVDVLVVPCAVSSPSLGLTIDEDADLYTTLPDANWEAGKQYVYIVTIEEGEKVSVSEAEILPWESSSAVDLEGSLFDPYNGHEYVDLGLPSGVKWATCNVGATKPEEYGDYYAWGETEDKTDYMSSIVYQKSYKEILAAGIVSSSAILTPSHDAAAVNWGGVWQMPTREKCAELLENCVFSQSTLNGKTVWTCVGPNGNKIIFPTSGNRAYSSELYGEGTEGSFWSSSINVSDIDEPIIYGSLFLSLESGNCHIGSWICRYGLPIRPISKY